MDYNQQNVNPIPPQSAPVQKLSGFSIASLCCGIAAIVCCCVGLSLPLGALAILFAVLTRRKGKSMDAMAISGIVIGAIGLVMGLVFSLSFFSIYEDPAFQQEMHDSFEDVYGKEYADILSELYGFDMEELN